MAFDHGAMAIIPYLEIILVLLLVLFLCFWSRNTSKSSTLTIKCWPLVGMLPGLLQNAHRIHEFATEVLEANGCTFIFKGPWFANADMVVTCDPANIHHILSKNFSNYPKGPEFVKIFDILGDGIFNADSELWEFHRKTAMSLIYDAKFQNFIEKTSWGKVEKGLVPVLDHVSELGLEVDLQDLFQRFTYDATCILALGYDPASLCVDLPLVPSEKAFGDAEEAVLYRHILPESCWKLQRWLQIGKERKLSKAVETFDHFLAHCISLKRQQLLENQEEEEDFDCLLTSYMQVCKENNSDKFLRDTLLSLVFAGRDTTSVALTWFFWLVARNPLVETKIRPIGDLVASR
uniref:Unspecific monooxygenase n=1 Tax=Davidia involucrata TaxID=16924 RepID=A0A5B7BEP7_DAVIN